MYSGKIQSPLYTSLYSDVKTILTSITYLPALRRFLKITGMILLLSAQPASAESINIALASNFAPAMEKIKQAFELQSEHRLKLIKSSSGKLYAQIRNGAPFDVFLSADQQRPQRLEEEGYMVAGSRQTYAIGRLALWSRDPTMTANARLLEDSERYQKLAIANPRLAPYGEAAMEVLSALNLQERVEAKLVMGENVAQAFQFAFSGGAELGFVAYSQVLFAPQTGANSYWLVPDSLYQPIRQDMVLLTDSAASRELQRFMAGDTAAEILRSNGYGLPEPVTGLNN